MSVSTYAELRAKPKHRNRGGWASNTITPHDDRDSTGFRSVYEISTNEPTTGTATISISIYSIALSDGQINTVKTQEWVLLEVSVVQGNVTDFETDVLVVNLFEGAEEPVGATGAVDSAINKLISALISEGEIIGAESECTLIHTPNTNYPEFKPSRVMVAGLGSSESFDLNTVRRVSASVVRKLRSSGAKRAATVLHGAGIGGLDPEASARALTEGSLLGSYRFTRYKTVDTKQRPNIEHLTIVEYDDSKLGAIAAGIRTGIAYSLAESLARDLVNEPANKLSPADLASVAERVARENGIRCQVLEKADVAKLGMGAYLGVAQGGDRPLKFVHMSYEGDPSNAENNLWLIGKGITFDSGGISLKPGAGMGKMKGDMGGGAAVIGAMQAISQLKPRINVHAVCAATDNMPGGSAQKPGDVVTAMNGKTIEVDNTDAEGRLTLADAIGYAQSKGSTRIVDVATLTGAARVALGDGVSAMFGNNEGLVNSVLRASETVGESMWRLPLDPVTKRQNSSQIADVKNTGGPGGGATTAAHFISEFAGETPWVHIDIAATSMLDTTRGWTPAGATGVPTRTLIELTMALGN
ncbi:MAG: leucyl aminopeptidase [Chloroflexi bacterium]|nr:leucyl aminopeptidase [Chloroflexota bacterium]